MNADEMSEMFTVKEALYQIKQQIEICEQMGEKSIRNERNKVLLNYITNLQKENEYLKLNNPEMNIKHFKTIKENKRKIDILRKQNKDYKSRNEKAIKKINNIFFTLSSNNENYNNLYIKLVDTKQGKDLLNILQGGDEK